MRRLFWVFGVVCVCITTAGEATWQTVDLPPGDYVPAGLDGPFIVGRHIVGDARGVVALDCAFVYDGVNCADIIDARAWSISGATAVDHGKVIGYCGNSGQLQRAFIYENGALTFREMPGVACTLLTGIDAGNIVAFIQYYTAEGLMQKAALYSNGNWTILPNAPSSWWQIFPEDIDGTKIVGEYCDTGSPGHHGFLYEGGRWTTLDMPEAVDTYLLGIDGNRIVGMYTPRSNPGSGASRSFIYDYGGKHWIHLDKPGATVTQAVAIDGNRILVQCYLAGRSYPTTFLYGTGIYGIFLGVKDRDRNGNLIRGDLDAIAVHDRMLQNLQGFTEDHAILKTGDLTQGLGISKAEVEAAINTLKSQMGAGDTLIFFAASHGGDDLAPLTETTDTPGDEYLKLSTTWKLTDDLLTSYLTGLDDVAKWVFLDSCHSGGFWGNKNPNDNPNDSGDLVRLTNIALFSASSELGKTGSHPKTGQGLFTTLLADAFTLDDMHRFHFAGEPVFTDFDKLAQWIRDHGQDYFGFFFRERECGDLFTLSTDNWTPQSFCSPDFAGSFGGSIEATPTTPGETTPTTSRLTVCVGGNCFHLTVDPNAPVGSNTFIGSTTVSMELNFRGKFTAGVELIVAVGGTWSAWLDPEVVGPGAVTTTLRVKGENLDLAAIPDGSEDVQVAKVRLFVAPAS